MTLSHDFDTSIAFLRRLYPDQPWMLTAISVNKKKIRSDTFVAPHDESEVRRWLESHSVGMNIYYSVNQPTPAAYQKTKLAKSDVASVHYLHVDVDPRDGEDLESEQRRILTLLSGYRLRPSKLVFSGGGYNALWKLSEPIIVAGVAGDVVPAEAVRRAFDVERRNWQFELDFSTPDHCRDVSRILRLPGTVNSPSVEKLTKGRVAAMSRIVWDEDTIYDYSVFMATPAPVSDNVAQRSPSERATTTDVVRIESVDELKGVPEKVKQIIVQGRDPDDVARGSTSRSEPLFFVCCELLRCEIDESIILGIITDARFGISESILDKGARIQQYAIRQLDRARDVAVHPKLAEMNDKFAVIANHGSRCMVMSTQLDDNNDEPEYVYQRPADFKMAYDREKIVEEWREKPRTIGVGSWWFDHSRRRQYSHVVFSPGKLVDGAFNVWQGFRVEPVPGDRHLALLHHVRHNICMDSEEKFDYLMKWFARIVQQPSTNSQIAVILQGDMGSGKTILAEFFMETLPKAHRKTLTEPSQLTGKFNGHLAQCLFVFAEEAYDPRREGHAASLKHLITGDEMAVEYKGANIVQVKNYTHIMMSTNSDNVVPAGDKERRYLVMRVRSVTEIDPAIFEKISEDKRSATGPANFLHYLMSIDLTGFDVRKVPRTDELRVQQEGSMSLHMEWLLYRLELGTWDDQGSSRWTEVARRTLFESYLTYVSRNNRTDPLTDRKFALWFTNQFVGMIPFQMSPRAGDRSRPMALRIPELSECRRQFAAARGWRDHVWPEAPTDDPATPPEAGLPATTRETFS